MNRIELATGERIVSSVLVFDRYLYIVSNIGRIFIHDINLDFQPQEEPVTTTEQSVNKEILG